MNVSSIRPRRCPEIETLEDRTCPTAAAEFGITVDGGTLQIEGDATRNVVQLRDDGAGHMTVSITREGGTKAEWSGPQNVIKNVTVNLGNGNDSFNFHALGNLAHDLYMNVDLGDGNDSADLTFWNGSSAENLRLGLVGGAGKDWIGGRAYGEFAGTNTMLKALLGDGNDTFKWSLEGDVTSGVFAIHAEGGISGDEFYVNALGDVGAEAKVNITLDGSSNGETDAEEKDSFTVKTSGKIDGALEVYEYGKGGADVLRANVTIAAGSSGSFVGHLDGGYGDDVISFGLYINAAEEDEGPTFEVIQAEANGRDDLDGSPGMDSGWTTSNVTRYGLEKA